MPPKYRDRRSVLEWMLTPHKRGMKRGTKCAYTTPRENKGDRYKKTNLQRCKKYKNTLGPYEKKTNKTCDLYKYTAKGRRCAKYKRKATSTRRRTGGDPLEEFIDRVDVEPRLVHLPDVFLVEPRK